MDMLTLNDITISLSGCESGLKHDVPRLIAQGRYKEAIKFLIQARKELNHVIQVLREEESKK